jgi:guanine deaminase
MYRETFMKRAIALSREALDRPGTEPFGAVIVKDEIIIGEGLNHSLAHFDPTSHGEVEAIRDACRRLECVDLSGAELYTSCEPCALCVATMAIVGISHLYYAASGEQAGAVLTPLTKAQRHPIDVDHLRAESGAPIHQRTLPATQALDAEAAAILQQWAAARAMQSP